MGQPYQVHHGPRAPRPLSGLLKLPKRPRKSRNPTITQEKCTCLVFVLTSLNLGLSNVAMYISQNGSCTFKYVKGPYGLIGPLHGFPGLRKWAYHFLTMKMTIFESERTTKSSSIALFGLVGLIR